MIVLRIYGVVVWQLMCDNSRDLERCMIAQYVIS
jgi:hypothetical protein